MKTTRNKSAKDENATAMEGIDVIAPSQSSSDDGMMATIAQQMQATMERKKKEKETKFLQATQCELTKILSERTRDFTNNIENIDKIFSSFQDAYAKNEDHIRKLLEAIAEEQLKLQSYTDEMHQNSVKMEKAREKEHIQALTHGRRACEEFDRLVGHLESSIHNI